MITLLLAGAKLLPGIALRFLKSHLEARADLATEKERGRVRIQLAEIDSEIEWRKANRDIVIAEQQNVLTRMIRPLLAIPFVIYIWKVVVWDVVLGLGTTDPLRGSVGEWAGVIVLAYFAARPVEKVGAMIARSIKR